MAKKKADIIELDARRGAKKPKRARCVTIMPADDKPPVRAGRKSLNDLIEKHGWRWAEKGDPIYKRGFFMGMHVLPRRPSDAQVKEERLRPGPFSRYTIEPMTVRGELMFGVYGWSAQNDKSLVERFRKREDAEQKYPTATGDERA